MRFRFLGGQEAPDWVLSESRILSRLEPEQLERAAAHCAALLVLRRASGAVGGEGDAQDDEVAALLDLVRPEGPVRSAAELRALVACLNVVLLSAVKYSVEPAVLGKELSQLGLPRESCEAILRALAARSDELRSALAAQLLRLARPRAGDAAVGWRVQAVLGSKHALGAVSRSVQIAIPVQLPSGAHDTVAFEADEAKFRVLLHELRRARALMSQDTRAAFD
jgi:hypothetical protein